MNKYLKFRFDNQRFMKQGLTLLLIFVFHFPIFAQNETQYLENQLENSIENSENEDDYSSVFDYLNQIKANPINLNSATREDLEKIAYWSDIQIDNLLIYREKYGKMYSIYELLYLEGFTKDDILILENLVYFGKEPDKQPFTLSNLARYGTNEFLARSKRILERQKGFLEDSSQSYLGKPQTYYLRYKLSYQNRFSFGFTAENDAGEPFQKQGFDFYSAHLELNNIGKLKTLVLGDFVARWGQGLMLWKGFRMNKSSNVLNINKKGQGLQKYTASDENRFLRGIGTTFKFGNWTATAFYSHKSIDGNLSKDTSEITSFQTTGLHRTESELFDKQSFKETVFGSNLSLNGENYRIGFNAIQAIFSKPLAMKTELYQKFELVGKKNANQSIDYQYYSNGFRFFGETALSQNRAVASLNGVLFSPTSQVAFSLLHRYYQPNYQAVYANAFGESSKPENESGFYSGIELTLNQYIRVSGYYDSFRFDWLRYQIDAPSKGQEYFCQVNFTANRFVSMYLRFKQKNKFQNKDSLCPALKKLEVVKQTNVRYTIDYQLFDNLFLRNRIELVNWNTQYGKLIMQNLEYHFLKLPLSISTTYTIFDTDSYYTRIYLYQSDAVFSTSITPFYMKGTNFSTLLKYSYKSFDFWGWYATTFYGNKNEIGTGLAQIQGHRKSELKVQVRFRF